MSKKEDFIKHITEGYTAKERLLSLAAYSGWQLIADTFVKIPLKTLK
jgi:hypothetical protein